jgi:hypothetical protein
MIVGNNSAGAVFDISGKYRYALWRVWDISKLYIGWILLNPSTADELKLDPTLRRCKRFSEGWGYGGFYVFNVFGLKSTNPKELIKSRDPIGNLNDSTIIFKITCVSKIIVGWGNNILKFKERYLELDKILCHEELYALKVTNLDQPSHPLYLKKDLKPFLYKKKNCKIR